MIARLTGTVAETFEGGCVLDVAGVGYLLACSRRTLDALAAAAPPVRVLVDTHVREDAITLHGFATEAERAAFRKLLSVQGVGGKVALDILSALPPEALAAAVRAADRAALRRAPGVGPRLAERLVTELRDWAGGAVAVAVPAGVSPDAVSALVNLGWRAPEAEAAVGRVAARLGPDVALSMLIRDALRELS